MFQGYSRIQSRSRRIGTLKTLAPSDSWIDVICDTRDHARVSPNSLVAARNQSSDWLPSVTPATAGSVNADGLQFIAPCVGDRRFAAVGQHDRRTVGGVERE